MDSSQHHILVVFLGLFYLVVTTDMFFFSLLKQKTATVGPFEERGGAMKKNCVARPSKEKCIILETSGVIRGDLETFWSDFRMQNHCV